MARARAIVALRRERGPAFWAVFDQVIVSGTNFLTAVFIARTLGRYDFGLFTLAWFYVLLVLSVQFALIAAPMFSLGPERAKRDEPAYFTCLLLAQMCFAGLVFVVVLAGATLGGHLFGGWAYSRCALALATAAAAFLWQDFVRRALFARGMPRMATLCDLISYPGQLAVLVVLLRPGAGLNVLLWTIAATSAAAAAVGLCLMRPLRLDSGSFRAVLAEHWAFSRWLLGTTALVGICVNAAYVVVGAVLGAASVAGLRAAELIFALGNPFYQSIDNFMPAMAKRRLLDSGLAGFKRLVFRWTVLGVGFSAAISLVAIAAPRLWLGLVFGPDMTEYSNLVYPLAARQPIILLLMMGGIVLRSRNQTAIIMASEAVQVAVIACTAYPVIAQFGVLGAAIAHASWPVASLIVVAIGVRNSLRDATGVSALEYRVVRSGGSRGSEAPPGSGQRP